MPDWTAREKRVLGANLKRARLAAAINRPELKIGYRAAAVIGATPAMLTNWESGGVVPELPWMIRLAVVYGVKVDQLLYGTDEDYNAILKRDWPVDVQGVIDAQKDDMTERIIATLLAARGRGQGAAARDSAPIQGSVDGERKTNVGRAVRARPRRVRRK